MNILKIAILVLVILFILYIWGMKITSTRIKRLIEERNSLDLSTPEGRARKAVINAKIDDLYGLNR